MCAHLWNARCRRLLVGRFIAGGAAMICVNSGHMTPAGPKDGGPVRFRSGNSAGSGARRSQQRREGPEEAAGTRVIGNSPGPLRAVTGGVVPLPLGGPRRLTRCRRLPCLLASQTALTPSAKPPGKPGLHHAHLPLFHGRAMASQAGRVAAPPADPRLVLSANVSAQAQSGF